HSRPQSFLAPPAPAPSTIYTLSLHDALPIFSNPAKKRPHSGPTASGSAFQRRYCSATYSLLARATLSRLCIRESFSVPAPSPTRDRKSTRLNSSHDQISYAVFCLKKKTFIIL